jgi:hypothetical protein
MWQTISATTHINGSSSMTTDSAISRELTSFSGDFTITGWELFWQVMLGAGAPGYTDFATFSYAQIFMWLTGLSFVPTGGSVPNLLTDPDNTYFLDSVSMNPYWDRNTVNTAGAPSYQDQWHWAGVMRGRCDMPVSGGGTTNWHLALPFTGVHTAWDVWGKTFYALPG